MAALSGLFEGAVGLVLRSLVDLSLDGINADPSLRCWKAGALPVKLGIGGVEEWLNPAVLKPKIADLLSDIKFN